MANKKTLGQYKYGCLLGSYAPRNVRLLHGSVPSCLTSSPFCHHTARLDRASRGAYRGTSHEKATP